MFPSDNILCDPVRLVDKYVSLLPPVGPKTKKYNFYLRSLDKPNPVQWYGEQVVGCHNLTKVVSELLKTAKLDGFFTNHSLRCTGMTHLFQAGVDKKVIKEYTGHVSNAVEKYQVTSERQREDLSAILAGTKGDEKIESPKTKANPSPDPTLEVTVKGANTDNKPCLSCSCIKSEVKMNDTQQIGTLINGLIASHHGMKTTVRV